MGSIPILTILEVKKYIQSVDPENAHRTITNIEGLWNESGPSPNIMNVNLYENGILDLISIPVAEVLEIPTDDLGWLTGLPFPWN